MASQQPKKKEGVVWNDRSTMAAGKRIWAHSVGNVNGEFADQILAEPTFRQMYSDHLVKVVEQQMKSSEICLEVATRGLEKAWEEFSFVRGDEQVSLQEAMQKDEVGPPLISVGTVRGEQEVEEEEKVWGGSSKDGSPLSPHDLLGFCQKWAQDGSMEPDVPGALQFVHENPQKWKECLSKKVFVLIGATSEMGPLKPLLSVGAHVLAIARPGAQKWDKLKEIAKSSPGTLSFPVIDDVPGADVLTQAPEIRNFLCSVFPDQELVVGSYIYLDGEAHVRATMAMDAIIKDLAEKRPNTIFSWIVSPATVYPISADAYNASAQQTSPWWAGPLAFVTGSFTGFQANTRPPVRGVDAVTGQETDFYVHDGLINFQGPNYALAKTLQNWRTILLSQSGHKIAAMHGPPTRTESVTHSAAAKKALEGLTAFPPMTAGDVGVVSPILATLLMYHVMKEENEGPLSNPYFALNKTAWHGGSWRCAYKANSLGTAAYILGSFS